MPQWWFILQGDVRLLRHEMRLTNGWNFFLLHLFKLNYTPCPFPEIIFKESTLWADSFYKSKCPCVCLSVKKWSQIWKLLFIKGVKLPWQKKFFLMVFFWDNSFYWAKLSVCVFVCLFFCPSHFLTSFNSLSPPPLHKVQCPNFLNFRNPWGKVM